MTILLVLILLTLLVGTRWIGWLAWAAAAIVAAILLGKVGITAEALGNIIIYGGIGLAVVGFLVAQSIKKSAEEQKQKIRENRKKAGLKPETNPDGW